MKTKMEYLVGKIFVYWQKNLLKSNVVENLKKKCLIGGNQYLKNGGTN